MACTVRSVRPTTALMSRMRALGLHANAYVVKPTDFDEFTQTVCRIGEFFLSAARVPPLVFYGPADGVPGPTATAAPAHPGRPPKRTNTPEAHSIHAQLGNADRGRG